jgi:hypothetical protein
MIYERAMYEAALAKDSENETNGVPEVQVFNIITYNRRFGIYLAKGANDGSVDMAKILLGCRRITPNLKKRFASLVNRVRQSMVLSTACC